jgi:electron transport complex protein RnfC
LISETSFKAIKSGKIWHFHGGIHPDGHKETTAGAQIEELEIPNILAVPLRQTSLSAGELIVKEGDKVLKGQPLTRICARGQVPVHAPTSGKIKSIGLFTASHPSGFKDQAVVIIPDGEDEWLEHRGCSDFTSLTPEEIADRVTEAGIAGMGGAGFPAGYKLKSAIGKTEILIINGCECEPYLTADDALMREKADEITEGIRILQHALKPKLTIMAIEANKPEAAEAMRKAIKKAEADIDVRILPVRYPTGAARPLIYTLTGIEVGYDSRSNDYGVTMHNVASVYAIKRAVTDGEPCVERVVTVTGNNFRKNGNYRLMNGTLVKHLINKIGLKDQKIVHMIIGGPMMGFSVPSMDTPLVKTSGCVIAPDKKELPVSSDYINCIKCGRCQEVCPSRLVPYMLLSHARARNFDGLRDCHFKDCIQCGCCTYVCSSRIPLVSEFRMADAALRKLREEERSKKEAQELISFKTERTEHEKAERQARIDALKQKSRTEKTSDTPAESDARKRAGALAQEKAKALQSAQNTHNEEVKSEPGSITSADNQASDPVARAKAIALAKAKARMQAQSGIAAAAENEVKTETAETKEQPLSADSLPSDPVARAKAIALAKAKARMQAQSGNAGAAENEGKTVTAETKDQPQSADGLPADPVARAKAIALAKAKARMQAQSGNAAAPENEGKTATAETKEQPQSADGLPADPVARAKAIALAKAKARMQQKKDNS